MGIRTFLLLALASCGPRHAADPIRWNAPFDRDARGEAPGSAAAPFDDLRQMSPGSREAWVRRQFTDPEGAKAAVHRRQNHLALDCPVCLDPMRAILPEEAWLTGPAEVWN